MPADSVLLYVQGVTPWFIWRRGAQRYYQIAHSLIYGRGKQTKLGVYDWLPVTLQDCQLVRFGI